MRKCVSNASGKLDYFAEIRPQRDSFVLKIVNWQCVPNIQEAEHS